MQNADHTLITLSQAWNVGVDIACAVGKGFRFSMMEQALSELTGLLHLKLTQYFLYKMEKGG